MNDSRHSSLHICTVCDLCGSLGESCRVAVSYCLHGNHSERIFVLVTGSFMMIFTIQRVHFNGSGILHFTAVVCHQILLAKVTVYKSCCEYHYMYYQLAALSAWLFFLPSSRLCKS